MSKVSFGPCSVNLTGKRENAGHEKATVNITVIIGHTSFSTQTITDTYM